MMLYGSRTTVMGIALLATSYWGSKKANLAMVWCGTFVALTDGFVSKRTIDGGEWNHWGFVSSFFLTTFSNSRVFVPRRLSHGDKTKERLGEISDADVGCFYLQVPVGVIMGSLMSGVAD
jgi:hypothetical protein